MAERLNTQLRRAYLDLKRKSKIENFLRELNARKPILKKELVHLNNLMAKEYLDVVRLEKKRIRPLFQFFLGTLEEALDKERQEFLLAVLNHQAKEQELKSIYFQEKVLSEKLIELKSSKKDFEKIKKKYFIQVNLNDPKKAKRLTGIRIHILEVQGNIREIKEALAAAKKSTPYLDGLRNELQQLNPWGLTGSNLDMGGKGRMSSYKKKKFIDKTKVKALKTKKQLDKFELELRDVSNSIKVNFDVELLSIKEFLDVFFDNLITDWIVKDKIESAIMSIDIIQDRILRTEKVLQFEKDRFESEIKTWETRSNEILLE